VCHCPFVDVTFWSSLLAWDQQIAAQVQAAGCPHCGGALHVANYPRKPRGEQRQTLGEAYTRRLSFSCAREGCRRRTTPPSVRFLGRKVYLGAVISVLSAGAKALSNTQFSTLIEQLNLPAQTLNRWRLWWNEQVPASAYWQSLSGWFSPPISPRGLPGELLVRVQGSDLCDRLWVLLQLLSPLSCGSGALLPRVVASTQKM